MVGAVVAGAIVFTGGEVESTPSFALLEDGEFIGEIRGPQTPDFFTTRRAQIDGERPYTLSLTPLPDAISFAQAKTAGTHDHEYLQTAGDGDILTVELRAPGGTQWGAEWVRYVVGHRYHRAAPRDIALELPYSTEFIAESEVFYPSEAGEIFHHYTAAGTVPAGYTLRPVEGYTEDGRLIDLSHIVEPVTVR